MGGRLVSVSTDSHAAPATGMPFGGVIEDECATCTLACAYEAEVRLGNKVADTFGQRLQQLFGRVPPSPFADTERVVGFRSAGHTKSFLNLAILTVGGQQVIQRL